MITRAEVEKAYKESGLTGLIIDGPFEKFINLIAAAAYKHAHAELEAELNRYARLNRYESRKRAEAAEKRVKELEDAIAAFKTQFDRKLNL